jgi:cobalt-zinc-cadmium efflux system protein
MAHHGHHHHGHRHDDVAPGRLALALGLIVGLMTLEVVAGILAGSLALLSDAAHMLTDAGALLLALIVVRLVQRPAGGNLTFGLRRAEILSGLLVYGGIHRLVVPPSPGGWTMIVVACIGVVVNLVAVRILEGAGRESLNVEGAYQHVLTDLVAFVATAIAGVLIVTTGFVRADGIAALVVAAIMLRSSVGLLRDSGRVLLEAAPEGMSVEEIGNALASHPNVQEIHDLHVWELGSGFTSLSAHVLVRPGDDCHAIRRELEVLLNERFGIEHTTLQVDHETSGRLLSIDPARS